MIAAVLATLLALWLVRELATLVWLVAISIFLSLALEPAVRWLVGRFTWRRGSSVAVIYLAGLVGLVLMVGFLIPAFVELANQVGDQGPSWIASLDAWTDDNFGFVVSDEVEAASALEDVDGFLGSWADEAFGAVSGIASAGAELVFSVGTVALFTFYFAADSPRLTRMVLSWFRPERQDQIGWTFDQAIEQTGGYFYARLALLAINATGFFITMVIVGMPVGFAFPLAIFGGFVSAFIPAIGTYLGAAIPIVVTLAVQGFVPGLVVLGYAVVYQGVENYFLEPRISSNTMELSGPVAFGSAIAGGTLAGPIGAFMALPFAALVTSFVKTYGTSYEVVYESESTRDTDAERDAATTPEQSE